MPLLHCLGAAGEVGRSAFLLETDKRLLLDYGIKIFGKGEKPEYPLPLPENVDAALISHAHLDHSGFVPYLYTFSQLRWYATPPTRDICEVLFADSMKIMGDELPYALPHLPAEMAVPVSLDRILQRALAKKPDDRYPTILEMKREIEACG